MGELRYRLWITTGDQPLAGTDSLVYIMLYGTQGQSAWIPLPARDIFAFEAGATDAFALEIDNLGPVQRCCLAHDASADPGWYVRSVRVEHVAGGREYRFQFETWITTEEEGRLVACADGSS